MTHRTASEQPASGETIDPDDLETLIDDAISDSFELDWTSMRGARAVVGAFEHVGWSVVKGQPISTTSEAPEAGRLSDKFLPIEEWDQRDEAVLLLVDYTDGDHPLDDATVALTIGHNNDHNIGPDDVDGWKFAGWCWSHDHYVEGKGTPIGWMPLPHHLAAALSPPCEGAGE